MRKHIAIVSQNVTLFNDTIFNNIAYGELAGCSAEQVQAAAVLAHAHDFIEQMTEGYETHIGDDGVMLSGGQRQRIAIARALLKDAPVLILDEATSALDNQTEQKIMQQISQLKDSQTVFIIAHRITTLKQCDSIFKMNIDCTIERVKYHQI